MEHAKHIIRAVLLLALISVVFVLVRHFLRPDSYGVYGAYRYDSVAEYATLQPRHGAPDACKTCHDEESQTKNSGKHASVSCEVCHDPLVIHVEDNKKTAPMTVRRSYKRCGLCHQRLIARRDDFPQIVLIDHVIEKGEEMAEAVCLECHDAHNPSE